MMFSKLSVATALLCLGTAVLSRPANDAAAEATAATVAAPAAGEQQGGAEGPKMRMARDDDEDEDDHGRPRRERRSPNFPAEWQIDTEKTEGPFLVFSDHGGLTAKDHAEAVGLQVFEQTLDNGFTSPYEAQRRKVGDSHSLGEWTAQFKWRADKDLMADPSSYDRKSFGPGWLIWDDGRKQMLAASFAKSFLAAGFPRNFVARLVESEQGSRPGRELGVATISDFRFEAHEGKSGLVREVPSLPSTHSTFALALRPAPRS